MRPRLRRLTADYEDIKAAFVENPLIRLLEAEGGPPERYIVQFDVEGLVPEGERGCQPSSSHRTEIFLAKDYPRRPPICRMLSPVFHPNINPQKICIGDHWSAGQSLVHLIVRIGEMICFQSYNVKSPLNGWAAAWVEANEHKLPLYHGDVGAGSI